MCACVCVHECRYTDGEGRVWRLCVCMVEGGRTYVGREGQCRDGM